MPRSDPVGKAGKLVWATVGIAVVALAAAAGYAMLDHPAAAPARGSAGSLQQSTAHADARPGAAR